MDPKDGFMEIMLIATAVKLIFKSKIQLDWQILICQK